jgi:hypothetical protein
MGVTIRKRNGKWYVFVNYRGRRKAKCIGSRGAAEQVRRQLEAKLVLGDFAFLAEPTELTLQQYSQRWLKQYAEVELKSSTADCYAQFLRLYVLPRFGQLQVTAIQRSQVKDFLGAVCEGGAIAQHVAANPLYSPSHPKSCSRRWDSRTQPSPEAWQIYKN